MSVEETTMSLPTVTTSLDSDAVFATLLKLSKQGKLAGFEILDGGKRAIADAHGTPFDSDLLIEHVGGEVQLSLSLRKRIPAIFAALLIITVWPGLPLTDSFMYSFGWYERLMGKSVQTWMWYLPMTVIPIPFVWKSSIKKSRNSAHKHALETIEKMRTVLG